MEIINNFGVTINYAIWASAGQAVLYSGTIGNGGNAGQKLPEGKYFVVITDNDGRSGLSTNNNLDNDAVIAISVENK